MKMEQARQKGIVQLIPGRVLLPGLLGMMASACSSATSSNGPWVEFYKEGSGSMAPMFTATGGSGTVEARGQYGSGTCHARETQRATLRADTLTLRIELSGQKSECNAIWGLVPYRAVIGGLEPGQYIVRVEHVGTRDKVRDDQGNLTDIPAGLRLETAVTVR